MGNIGLGQGQPEPVEDDESSVVLSDLDYEEDGKKLNKRERKLLQKSK